jgi:hypothetical protein
VAAEAGFRLSFDAMSTYTKTEPKRQELEVNKKMLLLRRQERIEVFFCVPVTRAVLHVSKMGWRIGEKVGGEV